MGLLPAMVLVEAAVVSALELSVRMASGNVDNSITLVVLAAVVVPVDAVEKVDLEDKEAALPLQYSMFAPAHVPCFL